MKFSQTNEQVRDFYKSLIRLNESAYTHHEAKEQAVEFISLIQASNYDLIKDLPTPHQTIIYSAWFTIWPCITDADPLDVRSPAQKILKWKLKKNLNEIEKHEFAGDFLSLATLATAYTYATKTYSAALSLNTIIEDATNFINDVDLQNRLKDAGENEPAIKTLYKLAQAAIERNGDLIKELSVPQVGSRLG